MDNYKIGIKLADGSFYPILEEGNPQVKTIELTTVRDDQTTVQLDLYRSSSDDMEDAEYVDTLLVENLLPRPKETPTLNLKIEIDSDNVLSASIEDSESGESSETKVSLVNLDSSERTIVPDFSMIDANQDEGTIKIRPWQLKLFKCVTPYDFYVVIGAHKALIVTQHCQGYRNFGFSLNTYNQILNILQSNYKWNKETMYNVSLKGSNNIAFTWALGSTPMSIKGLDDWIVVWNKKEVKGEIDGNIK